MTASLASSPLVLSAPAQSHLASALFAATSAGAGDAEDNQDRVSLADSMDVATILERLIRQPLTLVPGGTPSSPGGLSTPHELRLTSSGKMIAAGKDDPGEKGADDDSSHAPRYLDDASRTNRFGASVPAGWQPERRFSMPGGAAGIIAGGAGSLLSRMRKASKRLPGLDDPSLGAVLKANGSNLALPEAVPAPPVLISTDAGAADGPGSADRDSMELHLPCPPDAARVVSVQQAAATPPVEKPIMEEVRLVTCSVCAVRVCSCAASCTALSSP